MARRKKPQSGGKPERNGNGNSKPSNRGGSKPRGKESEINVPDADINAADVVPIKYPKGQPRGGNDGSWYNNIPGLLENVANFPFTQMTGLNYTMESGRNTPYSTLFREGIDGTIPGIMQINFIPTTGPVTKNTDAINVAAQQIFVKIRQKVAGSMSYDKTDVMMLVEAMNDAYALYAELIRAYRCLGNIPFENRYLPDDMLKALGYSPNLKTHLADFRSIINYFVYKLASIKIPDQFDAIKRRSFMNSNIYTDAPSLKGQMYVFKQAAYHIWTEGQEGKPTYLKHTSRAGLFGLSASGLVENLDQIQTAIDKIMDPLQGSSSVGQISGQIATAFGESGCITLQIIDEYNWLDPVYNMEVINQIMNMDLQYLPPTMPAGFNDVTQYLEDTSAGPMLRCSLPIGGTQGYENLRCSRNTYLNLHELPVNPTNVMTSTRFLHVIDMKADGTGAHFSSTGTEIIIGLKIIRYPGDNGIEIDSLDWIFSSSLYQSVPMRMSPFSCFDNAPIVYLWQELDRNANSYEYKGPVSDLDQNAVILASDIKRLNDLALMSLYKVKDY